ncbi:MAG: antibiotic biosynthesis monooxygenase [Syntrophus sp. (in: bacteria)]|nr:antibiotic biosynthesis monooxygenase [Syntrophus sp. (in: bacteria)]
MLIAIIQFPPVKTGKNAEFQEWFAWSNKEFAKIKGFIRRRLLKPVKGDAYVVIMELESTEVFTALQGSPAHSEAGMRVKPLLDGLPTPELYEIIIDHA